MRKLLLTAALLCCATPAFAGVISFTDGRGSWQATHCVHPLPPGERPMGPEAPASALNGVTENYNAYVEKMQAYIQCLGSEAQTDISATSGVVNASLQGQVAQAQGELNAARTSFAPGK